MGIDINLTQKGIFKKKINLQIIKDAAKTLNIATSDNFFRIKTYKDEPLDQITLLLYDPNLLSRGFTLEVNKKDTACFLRQTYFCNDNDIYNFFQFIKNLASLLNINEYEKDGELFPIHDIPTQIEKEINFNRHTLIDLLKRFDDDDFPNIIYAVKNPISIETAVAEKLLQMKEEDVMKYWSNYLHEKQKDDYYYACPSFYHDKTQKDIIFGSYALTENCYSVFPTEPYIPYGYNLKTEDISNYQISIVDDKDFNVIAIIPYEDLWKYFPIETLKSYDSRHVYLLLTRDIINNLKEKEL